MTWYLLNISFLFVMGLSDSLECRVMPEETNRNRKALFVLETLIWIVLSGLRRWDIGEDTSTYAYMFEREMTLPWSSVWDEFTKKYILQLPGVVDPGYKVFEKITHFITKDYQCFLVIVAVIFFASLALFLYRNSYFPVLSYTLFSSMFYSFYALTGIRQTIATAIVVFLGTEAIKKRQLVRFVILTSIAATIHLSALCFFPFYWLSRIRIKKRTIGIYWILIVLSYIFKNNLFSALQFLIGYDQYSVFQAKTSPYTFLGLLLLMSVFVTLFYKQITKKISYGLDIRKSSAIVEENESGRMAVNALFISGIFSSLVLINPSCMRVVNYYSLFLMILLPGCVGVFNCRSKRLYVYVCMIVLTLLLLRNQPVYYFFWQ